MREMTKADLEVSFAGEIQAHMLIKRKHKEICVQLWIISAEITNEIKMGIEQVNL